MKDLYFDHILFYENTVNVYTSYLHKSIVKVAFLLLCMRLFAA